MTEHTAYFHPYKMMLFFLMLGMSALFLGLSASYLYTSITMNVPPIKLPFLFIINTLILLCSSWMMKRANQAYLDDETEVYKRCLWTTLVLTILFMGAQYMGWQMLQEQGLFLSGSPTTSYLYVISGAHILHILGGLPFLLMFLYKAVTRMKEPMTVLLYFSDPSKKLKLQLLTIYWHFLDALWIYLVVFFLITGYLL